MYLNKNSLLYDFQVGPPQNMDVSDDGEVFGRSRENRRESVDSIDQELDWLIKKEENKNNLLYAPDNKVKR